MDLHAIAGMPKNPLLLQAKSLRAAPGAVNGDVDLLIVERGAPQAAVAVEIKRVKVHAPTFRNRTPNKLHEYKKAVAQANQLARVGFGQVYLYVFVVVDSREHNRGRVTYAGLTSELRAAITAVISPKDLDPRIGLALFELIQPMDFPPLSIGAGGIHLERLATATEQPTDLTRWIADLVSSRS